jgi:ubiquinone/menaquinone biosynthesis C-methylase UbiE
MHGADLLTDRLANAQLRFPGVRFVLADGQTLPYRNGQFDIVLQYTMFSSILNSTIKVNIARDMLRVVKKPNGLIIWYDFWLNPVNPHTKGIRKAEIKQLFPNCDFTFRRVTLAPPISRKLITLSWGLCELLEKVKLLNSHYLVAIRPK